MDIKLTLFSVSPLKLAVGPISVHANGDLTAHGSPRLPRLSSSTPKASGTSAPIRSIALRYSILGNSKPSWWSYFFRSSFSGIFLFEMGNFSTDQNLGMVMDCSPSMSVTWSSTSIPFLSRLSPFNVVNENLLLILSSPNLTNSRLSHSDTSDSPSCKRHTFSPLDFVLLLESRLGRPLGKPFPHWLLWSCTELHWLFFLLLVGYYFWYLQDPLVPLGEVVTTRYEAFFVNLAIHRVNIMARLKTIIANLVFTNNL